MRLYLLLFLLPFTSTPIGYRQLTWGDYKGVPPKGVKADACTCTNIVIGADTAYAIFVPEKSWTKTNSPEVLRHEQVHFAITNHWAGMVDWCLKLSDKDRQSYASPVEDCINKWKAMEKRYDAETNHGTDTLQQKRWEELIKL